MVDSTTAESQDYKVDLEVFEGPLDLLLYLIKKDEVDIYDIPIETITTQYMNYLSLMRMLDFNIAGDFIVMAATLMMIKSRMLLPVDERPELEDEEDDDPRWDLVRQLVEYKKFKDAASHLHDLQVHQENVFAAADEPVEVGSAESGVTLEDVNIFELLSALNTVLKRVEKEELAEIFPQEFTVADKIEVILESLRTRGRLAFTDLFNDMATRYEIVTTFLALLELIRLRQVDVVQKGEFGDIFLVNPAA